MTKTKKRRLHLWAEGPLEPLSPEIEETLNKMHERLTSMTPAEKKKWHVDLKRRLAKPDPEFDKQLAAFDPPVDWGKVMNTWFD